MAETAHANCEHEKTKSARDRCRKARAAQELAEAATKLANQLPDLTEAQAAKLRPILNRAEPVMTIQVNPGIWAKALEIAGGKASRIRVISATQVEVSS